MDDGTGEHRNVKGLINFIHSMEHRYVSGLKVLLGKSNPETIRGLEADLRTVRGTVGKIRTTAKREGYDKITKIIEEDIYKEGFGQGYDQKPEPDRILKK